MFQGRTEQFDDRKDSDTLVAHLKEANVPYEYAIAHGKAKPKMHTCLSCGLKHYTNRAALECCQ